MQCHVGPLGSASSCNNKASADRKLGCLERTCASYIIAEIVEIVTHPRQLQKIVNVTLRHARIEKVCQLPLFFVNKRKIRVSLPLEMVAPLLQPFKRVRVI